MQAVKILPRHPEHTCAVTTRSTVTVTREATALALLHVTCEATAVALLHVTCEATALAPLPLLFVLFLQND